MNTRVIYAHELDDEQKIVIHMQGEFDLEAVAAIEEFCHRQRFRICQRMSAELAQQSAKVSPNESARDG